MSSYTIISGSTRAGSQSGKVARYLQAELGALGAGEVSLFDLASHPLQQWHEGFWSETPPDPNWTAMSAVLEVSDAFVLVAPEWNGMAPPALMNLFLLAGGELAHKPALIVTVSAGPGGAYPVAELRAYGYKNTQICYIPEQVVVRNVKAMLNDAEPASERDRRLRDRITYGLQVLGAYAEGLAGVRAKGVIDRGRFPNGM